MQDKDRALIDDYRTEMSTIRGSAESTVERYVHEINCFSDFLLADRIGLLKAKREHFIKWRQDMESKKPAGIAIAISAMRSLYEWLSQSARLTPSPFPEGFKVKVKKQDPSDVPTVTQFLEMRAKLAIPRTDPRELPAIAREAIIETLAGTGLRIEAAMTLTPALLDLESPQPSARVVIGEVSCKGGVGTRVPMSLYCASVLKRYLEAMPPAPGAKLFPFSKDVVRKILRRMAPLGMKLKPHSLRHFYCSMLYYKNFDGGKNDVVWVRDAAAHSNIAVTDRYLKLARRIVQDDLSWELWARGPAQASAQGVA